MCPKGEVTECCARPWGQGAANQHSSKVSSVAKKGFPSGAPVQAEEGGEQKDPFQFGIPVVTGH